MRELSAVRASDRRGLARTAVLACATLAVAWLGGALVAAWLESTGGADWAVRAVYAPTCHQIPGRSAIAFGYPMAICSRCAGLVLGATLGLILGGVAGAWERSPRTILAGFAVAPSALDFVLGFTGLPTLDTVGRAAWAIPAGIGVGWIVAHGVGRAILDLRRSPRPNRPAGATAGLEE